MAKKTSAAKAKKSNNLRQPVIVWGKRTPFGKSFSVMRNLYPIDLISYALKESLADLKIPLNDIDEVIMGQVVTATDSVNIARDVVLRAGLPRHIPGFTLGRACASSLQSISSAADMIASGNADVVIAGGAESLSNPPIPFSKKASDFLIDMSKARTMPARLKLLKKVGIKDFLPQPPSITEPFTGKTMGQHAEMMAKQNGIKREDQDRFAYLSHKKAAEAWNEGIYDDQVIPIWSKDYKLHLDGDEGIRGDTSEEKLGKLRPVFDRKYGSVTAGNASPLTDGAACVIMMSREKADSLGLPILAAVKSYAYAALDPYDQLLLGPAYAMPKALKKAGLTIKDVDHVDMHEAFAAQVLSNLKFLGSKDFITEHFGDKNLVCDVDPEKMNPHGGSISIGHPFGATGARMVLNMAHALKRENKSHALLGLCAAGAMGGAMVLSNPDA